MNNAAQSAGLNKLLKQIASSGSYDAAQLSSELARTAGQIPKARSLRRTQVAEDSLVVKAGKPVQVTVQAAGKSGKLNLEGIEIIEVKPPAIKPLEH